MKSSVSVPTCYAIRHAFLPLLLLAAILLLLPQTAVSQTGVIGDVCVDNYVSPANCTANDVRVEQFFVNSITESCSQGVPGEAEVVMEVLITPNQCDRYGIGIFVNLEGESAISGDLCLHSYLAPFSSDPNDWNSTTIDGILTFLEPFPEINNDMCGDLPPCASNILKELREVRVQCRDTNGDGFVDINACASWENNQNVFCGGLEDTVPGTPSKCGCGDVPTDLPMPAALTVRKHSLGPDRTFSFETTSNPDLVGFALPADFDITTVDGEGQVSFDSVEPGNYTIDEIVPSGWSLDSAICSNGDDPQTAGGGVTLAPGDEVTCTFINSEITPGSIRILKSALGGDDTFNYTGDLGDFDLVTVLGECCQLFEDLIPGTYNVTEIVPDGWDLVDISCTDGSPTDVSTATASIDLETDEYVACTFTNVRRGSIEVFKTTNPEGGTGFDFDFGANATVLDSFTLDDAGSRLFDGLEPGSYFLNETDLPAGWDLSNINCTGANSVNVDVAAGTAGIGLGAGQTVQCTFTNTARGSLTIEKVTFGGDEEFGFTSATLDGGTLENPTEFTLDSAGINTITFDNLVSSLTWDVAEDQPPTDWTLLNASCNVNPQQWEYVSAEREISINILPGQDATCTFFNARETDVVLNKLAIGGDGTFDFDLLGPDSLLIDSTTLITGDGTASQDFSPLDPGEYTFVETSLPAGWVLTDLSCIIVDSGGGQTTVPGDLQTASVTFELAFGESVSCTFSNTADGTFIIEKATDPADSGQPFEFTGDVTGIITDGETLSIARQPGFYQSSESVPPDWALTDISCASDGPGSSFETSATGAGVFLAAGETARCVFANTELGSVTIVKNAVGGDDTFNFGGDFGLFSIATAGGTGSESFGNLLPGTYSVVEGVPAGWDLVDLSCDNASTVDIGSATATINVAAGEHVTCTFTDQRRARLTIEKAASGGDDEFEFQSNTLQPSPFSIDTAVNNAVSFEDLVPGTFDVTELGPPDGWVLLGAVCDAFTEQWSFDLAGQEIVIDLLAGQDVTCSFQNALQGTVSLTKTTIGGEDSFDFELRDAADDLIDGATLTTTPCCATEDFGSLPPGQYRFVELGPPAGWTLTDVFCSIVDDEGAEAFVQGDPETREIEFDLADGDTVNCTFINTADGTIIVQKATQPPGSPQGFVFTGDLADTISDGEQIEFSAQPGNYTSTETVPGGWALTDISCVSDGPNSDTTLINQDTGVNVSLDAGEEVVCTFTNTQLGSFTVVKSTDPAGSPQTFTFTGDAAGTLTDGQSIELENLLPGIYQSFEQVPDEWVVTGIDCQGAETSQVTTGESSVTLDLAAGEDVVCTFNNQRQPAAITIEKTASQPTVELGETYQYSVVVSSLGPATAENVVMTDPLADSLIFESVSPTPECSEVASLVTCQIGDMPPGTSFEAIITVTVCDDPAVCGTIIPNSATADGDNVEPVSEDADVNVLGPDEAMAVPLGGPLAVMLLGLLLLWMARKRLHGGAAYRCE